MKFARLLKIRLNLFDGGTAGAGAGAAAPAADNGTEAGPASVKKGKSEYANVKFGKQETPAAASETGTEGPHTDAEPGEGPKTLEEKRKTFMELVNGEYKDVYTEETRRMIDRRFREVREQTAQYQPLVDLLSQRYGVTDGDVSKLTAAVENDNAYWSDAAEKAGMSVEQYKQLQQLQRENMAFRKSVEQMRGRQQAQMQMQKWMGEAEEVKGLYEGFDLGRELQNPQFLPMLKSGVPMRTAYEVIHMEDIKAGIAAQQARTTEKQIVDGIRAKGARPQENGTSSQSAFTVKDDVSKLSKKDRAEIARRAARGEKIKF